MCTKLHISNTKIQTGFFLSDKMAGNNLKGGKYENQRSG